MHCVSERSQCVSVGCCVWDVCAWERMCVRFRGWMSVGGSGGRTSVCVWEFRSIMNAASMQPLVFSLTSLSLKLAG